MNTELITLVLSLLGDIPLSAHPPMAQQAAVYATWESHRQAEFACPDLSSGIDPMGATVMVKRTVPMPDGSQTAVTMPVTVYPKTQTCKADIAEPHWKIFSSMIEAGQFRLDCPEKQCEDWHARDASEQEIVAYALEKRSWQIDHFPGGDMFRYPDGVFQVWPKNEMSFNTPLGTGSTPLKAIADALKGERP